MWEIRSIRKLGFGFTEPYAGMVGNYYLVTYTNGIVSETHYHESKDELHAYQQALPHLTKLNNEEQTK